MMLPTGWLLGLAATCCVFVAPTVFAMNPGTVATDHQALVPQRLLALLHAPEVQQELQLSEKQQAEIEKLFAEVDGPWFRSRILPADQQRKVVAELEQQVHRWFDQHASDQQHLRLRQLEVQAQGVRSLLRTDAARWLGLGADQQQELAELARKSDETRQQLAVAQRHGEALRDLESTAKQLLDEEQNFFANAIRPGQAVKLKKLTGEPFDTNRLKRIYPMAPEFAPVKQWLNSEPLSMQQLRGKVVLVHFYAFQCHNCHANFDVYQRWHKELTDRGVVVVGIQTPETSRERDPEAVKLAAEERDLRFPILVDLESKNWEAYGNTMWPTVYVIDKDGYIRHWWQGELRWKGAAGDQAIESIVSQLLDEK